VVSFNLCVLFCFWYKSIRERGFSAGYDGGPRKLMADLVRGGEEGEPANKRTRLESVVPAPAPAKKKVAATGQPPTSPPRPCPLPPPLWLSGQLPPAQRGRGSGHQNPTQRGGGTGRGSERGGNRGANRGQRRPARPLGPLVESLKPYIQKETE
jgi:hypothetical protein